MQFIPLSRILKVASLAAFMAMAALVTASTAEAAVRPLICGGIITRDTMLQSDIRDCPGDGLRVRGNNITINLNGHTVAGIGAQGNFSVGIRVKERQGVTVTNGTVTGFDAGVAVIGGSGNTFSRLDVHDNIGPPSLSAKFGEGFFLMSTANNLITNSHVAHNGPFDGIGIYGADPLKTGLPGPDPATTGNKIMNNVIEDNNLPVMFFGNLSYLDSGISLGAGFTGGSRTKIANNVIRRNVLNGITACSENGNPCITTDNVIVNNEISENGQSALTGPAPDTSGININNIIHIPHADFHTDTFYPATNDLVQGNLVHDNLGTGIVVGSGNNRIINNVAFGNGLQNFDGATGPLDLRDQSFGNSGGGFPTEGCGTNIWRGNTGVGFPACTEAGSRRQVTPPAVGAPAPAASAAARASVDSRFVFRRDASDL